MRGGDPAAASHCFACQDTAAIYRDTSDQHGETIA
jgi:hypothetical protein